MNPIQSIGTWIQLNNPQVVEIIAQSTPPIFDWMVVDMEHSHATFQDLPGLFAVMEKYLIKPFVRISSHDPIELRKCLDLGATGIIVPQVKSYTAAEMMIKAAQYKYDRGSAFCRANQYGRQFQSYQENADAKIKIFFQVESIAAIGNLSNLIKLKQYNCFSGFFIGPYDLSASMNISGEFDNPKYQQAIQEFKTICQLHNIPIGYHQVNVTQIKSDIDDLQSYNYVALGTDALFLQEGIKLWFQNRKE